MPRYQNERVFQIGDYWLSKQSRSDAWCRTWFDTKARQTKRASLRTADLDEAKQKLTDWFVLQQTKPEPESTKEVLLAEVFARFYEQHAKQLRSAVDAQRSLRYWLEFHGEATIHEAANQSQQEKFRDWLVTEKRLSLSSVRRALLVGKSALNWAYKRGDIEQVPYIVLVKPPRPDPKGRPLEIAEVAKLFKAAHQPHMRVLIAFMLGTAARTGAVLELGLHQIDLSNRLIELNPKGREQTLKYRPTVKLPEQLAPYIRHRQSACEHPNLIYFRGAPVKSIKTSWRKLRDRAGLDGDVQTYSFRHTIARWLRMQGVPAWEVASQLGHKAPDYTTTEIYAPFDPAYLSKATAAIDNFLYQVACELRVKAMSEFLLNGS